MSELPIDPTMPNLDDVGLAPERMQTDAVAVIGPSDTLAAINHLLRTNPDIEKMKAILAMNKELLADQRKATFAAALARLQGRCPQIAKNGRIIVKGVERSRFAKLEDIDVVIRPLLAEEGFAFSLDEEDVPEAKMRRYTGTLLHRDGHSETRRILLPIDHSDFRSVVQSIGSTQSFARRYLIKDFLNIVERDEDTDGVSLEAISEEQVRNLETQLKDMQANIPKFLEMFGVSRLEDIRVKDLKDAQAAIDRKRQRQGLR